MKYTSLSFSLLLISLSGESAMADGIDKTLLMIPTNQTIDVKVKPIYNLDDVIKEVKDFAKIPVLFPTIIQAEKGKIYFATTETQAKEQYMITIGSTPGCTAHFCTFGTVRAELNGKLKDDEYTVLNKKIDKVPVDLNNNIKGYYTEGYAICSFFDPKIEWVYKDVLYTIRWQFASQDELVQMANSAISAQ
ncbi:MAG: hypothetical protein ACD_16C00187G0002 [uncultured bacterium]|nr:MAG: hypothetical protein ACD_16C00187G0002 [uncultured bacterium]OFW69312.1 MAG: hypothetical protein A2X70_03810 [Alphaproteobacteria bacterium GWC2_42_16]OFW74030.1 MAG: hypothetical protein A2Z80_03285 [Alphaproteobacteria bacterium GWA2_41_27]OFW82999.1 MAG: hypothetical protein A3E50_00380 [Alphaproteobacteria bacterium RIFCSPHIGHO2_12_FULL_42_100]OFW90737.1 MAG: hypothetical protein A2W46_07480 [Alphaproteobacteria bacterium RIFCSPHIGHO2_12_42_13]OFW91984.1 MAG: hypothetical protein 